ncbi:hypothetical protein [Paenibacillus donghaensis]|uniref:Uncharacterized protein n=1 Tax=Paenibacillus donghaensis TaxID=414771 RepID=A0A2Z2KRY7_9BACL|nr:hypothetical protein [Paenibacillus donghaensis]ASA21818.1 hypothetical protein B9T62_14170 [Paenibacillus donghaensis]
MNIFENERCLFEEGQFLGFVRSHLGVSVDDLSVEMNIDKNIIDCFEDGDMYYLEDFNTLHSKYINTLDKITSSKGKSLKNELSNFVDFESYSIFL